MDPNILIILLGTIFIFIISIHMHIQTTGKLAFLETEYLFFLNPCIIFYYSKYLQLVNIYIYILGSKNLIIIVSYGCTISNKIRL